MESDEDVEMAAGMEFSSIKALKEHVARYCVYHDFAHNKPKNRRDYLKVVCSSHVECTFELRASLSSKTSIVRITFLEESHSAVHVAHSNSRRRQPSQVSQQFLVEVARDCLSCQGDKCSPKLVANWARTNYGLSISYHAAWRALKSVREGSMLSRQHSYQYVHGYLSMFVASNPGTLSNFERTSDDKFKRLSLVFGTFEKTLGYCIPIIAVDACHLRGADHGTLYVASTMTGAHDILVIGFAISNAAENGDDWNWFLSDISKALPCISNLADLFFMSDRDKGITPSVRRVFPSVPHSACAEHIKRNVIEECRTRFNGTIHDLAKETDKREVKRIFEEIRSTSENSFDYLSCIDRSIWISAYFSVPRYGIVTSNSAESINSSIGEFRHGSHLKVVAGIVQMVMRRSFDLKKKYELHEAMDIIPSVMTKINANKKAGRTRHVVPQADGKFAVERKNNLYRVVNLDANYCSCGLWVEYQYPCVHGCAALQKQHLSVLRTCAPYYRYGCLQSIFATSLNPIDIEASIADNTTEPPDSYRRAGRPKNPKRVRSRDEVIPEESPIICKRCGERGHNIRTCERRQLLNNENGIVRFMISCT